MPVFSATEVRQFGYIVEDRATKIIDQATPGILVELLESIDKVALSQRLFAECKDSQDIRCAPIDICSFDWVRHGVYPRATGVHVQWIDIVAQQSFLERFANCLGPKHFTVKMVKEGSRAVLRASFTARDHGRQKESKCLYNKTGFVPKQHVVEEGVCCCCGSYTKDVEGQARRRAAAQAEWRAMEHVQNEKVAAAEYHLAAINSCTREEWAESPISSPRTWDEARALAEKGVTCAVYNRLEAYKHFEFQWN